MDDLGAEAEIDLRRDEKALTIERLQISQQPRAIEDLQTSAVL